MKCSLEEPLTRTGRKPLARGRSRSATVCLIVISLLSVWLPGSGQAAVREPSGQPKQRDATATPSCLPAAVPGWRLELARDLFCAADQEGPAQQAEGSRADCPPPEASPDVVRTVREVQRFAVCTITPNPTPAPSETPSPTASPTDRVEPTESPSPTDPTSPPSPSPAPPDAVAVGTIQTFAGGGQGDGGPAVEASLSKATWLAANAAGDVYVSDGDPVQNRVRVIRSGGGIEAVAGSGSWGFSGDGGSATSAMFAGVGGIETGDDGTLYLADTYNDRIRAVDTSGMITTIAGSSEDCPCVDHGGGFTGDGGPAVEALISLPRAVTVDRTGQVYFIDFGNHRVRKIDRAGVITTVAGNGDDGCGSGSCQGGKGDGGPATEASLRHPFDLAVDDDGNLFISEPLNDRIRKVAPDGTISTFAGTGTPGFSGDGGPAAAASLKLPTGLEVDRSGNLFIADTQNNRVRRVDSTGTIRTIVGDGYGTTGAANDQHPGPCLDQGGCGGRFQGDGRSASAASLWYPKDIAVSNGSMFIADSWNFRIRRVDPSGIITTVAGNGRYSFAVGASPTTAAFDRPRDITFDSDGDMLIADRDNNMVRKVTATGRVVTIAGDGYKKCEARDAYVCEGRFTGDGGLATEASLNLPGGVATDEEDNVFIVDGYNHRIRRVDPDGIISTIAGNGANDSVGRCFGRLGSQGQDVGDGRPATDVCIDPFTIAVDDHGDVYFYDASSLRIRRIDASSGIISTYAGNGDPSLAFYGDGGPATEASIGNVFGLTFDGAGNLYLGAIDHSRVRKITPDGTIDTIAGNGDPRYSGDGGPATDAAIGWPADISVDRHNNVFINDFRGSNAWPVRMVAPDGTIGTVAGPCPENYFFFAGDGGPATRACLNYPAGTAVGPDGHLYISDASNNRIRRINVAAVDDPAPTPTPTASPSSHPTSSPQDCMTLYRSPHGDAPNSAPAGDGQNLDNLDLVSGSITRASEEAFVATIQVKDLTKVIPDNATSAHWYFQFTSGDTNYWAGASLDKTGSSPTFAIGTHADGVYDTSSTTTGAFNEGANGTIEVEIPRSVLQSSGDPLFLTRTHATTWIGLGINGSGFVFPIDRAPKKDGTFGRNYLDEEPCAEEVRPTPSPTTSPTNAAAVRGHYPINPNDPLFPERDQILGGQWGMRQIGSPEAWQQPQATGFGVNVAVLDTGLDLEHADLACSNKIRIIDGADQAGDGGGPRDIDGHGTHVAGIIGACTNNARGVVGVAPDSTLLPIQVFGGDANAMSIARGIKAAADGGAHVINMSLGIGIFNVPGTGTIARELLAEFDEAIRYAEEKGVVVVAAAGNDAFPICDYPALAEDIVCVGATDRREIKSWYSNFAFKAGSRDPVGPAVVAPGGSGQIFCNFHAENIVSTVPTKFDRCSEGEGTGNYDGYRGLDGTSMAAPHVSGVAALVYDRLGGVRSPDNARKVSDALTSTAVDLGAPGYDPVYGSGRVDALASVQSIEVADPDTSASPTADPSATATADPSATATADPSASPTEEPTTDPGPTTPAAPSNLTARTASSSRVELAWSDNSNSETGFAIERSLDGAEWSEIGTAGSNRTMYLDMGLDPDTTYFYRVRALNPSGYSPYSNTASATTPKEQNSAAGARAPAAPSDLNAASSSPSRIELSWNDSSNNEDGFALERSAGSTWQEIATVARNHTTYLDSGLAPETTYQYRVRAYNSSGHSTYSNVASAKTQPAPDGGGGGSSPSPSPSQSSSPLVEQLGTATTSISASDSLTTYNRGIELSGVVERDENCTGPLEVSISRRVHGTSTYEALASTPVNGAGAWGLQVLAQRNSSYIAQVKETESCEGEPSLPTDVLVKAKITVKVPLRCGGAIRGRLMPSYEGSNIVLQRRTRSGWSQVTKAKLDDDSRFSLRARRCGLHRVVWAEDGAANEPATSRFRVVNR